MRLPGTRYQEHGWEQVRKLLGRCSLVAFARSDVTHADGEAAQLALYVDLVAEALHQGARAARAEAPANSYGESVVELALGLLYELHARPAEWAAFRVAVKGDVAAGDAVLRKKVNDMYAVLRDKVDADNYQVACGRECSANKIYTYRMLDTAYGEIARIFASWHSHQEQVAAILGRAVDAIPIEVRQMKSIAQCKPEWVIRWSASLEQFGDGPGPMHTRSKRFASLKNNPVKIAEMMMEIGDYEELSSNRDQDWLDDLWRVLEAVPAEDYIEPPPEVCAAPRFTALAAETMGVRLAVYLKLLGSMDDSYPSEWLDQATGELPTMAQLATLDQVSLPTLRKRRDAAIAQLMAVTAPKKE